MRSFLFFATRLVKGLLAPFPCHGYIAGPSRARACPGRDVIGGPSVVESLLLRGAGQAACASAGPDTSALGRQRPGGPPSWWTRAPSAPRATSVTGPSWAGVVCFSPGKGEVEQKSLKLVRRARAARPGFPGVLPCKCRSRSRPELPQPLSCGLSCRQMLLGARRVRRAAGTGSTPTAQSSGGLSSCPGPHAWPLAVILMRPISMSRAPRLSSLRDPSLDIRPCVLACRSALEPASATRPISVLAFPLLPLNWTPLVSSLCHRRRNKPLARCTGSQPGP